MRRHRPISGYERKASGPRIAADSSTLRAQLAAGDSVTLGAGVFPISSPLTLVANSQTLTGAGPQTVIKCDDASDFKVALYGSGLTGIVVKDLTIDCNRAVRLAILTTRTIGLHLTSCSGAIVEGVTVRGTVGGPDTVGGSAMSGVAIALTQGTSNTAFRCVCRDCGTLTVGQASDAFYTSGTGTVIRNCQAIDCTDSAYVLENSNNGLIANCRSTRCSVGFAITNATVDDKSGNRATNIKIIDFSTSVTGGVQIGLPTVTASGDLSDTKVANVSMSLKASGTGPAVNLRNVNVGTGRISGVLARNLMIDGAGTQGVLIVGEGVTIADCRISDTGAAAVQVQPGCRDITVRATRIERPTHYGVVSSGAVDGLRILDNVIIGGPAMSHGVWRSSATTNDVIDRNAISGYTSGPTGRQTP